MINAHYGKLIFKKKKLVLGVKKKKKKKGIFVYLFYKQ